MKPRLTYLPGGSILHRLHPLAKGAWLVGGTVLLFVIQDPWIVLGFTAALLAAFPLARLPLAQLRGMRVLATTALLLGLLQFLFYREGDVLVQIGPLTLARGGLEAGLYVAGRFVSVVLLSYLFVLTTEPNELAFALMSAGLPYRYGFTLITALRMVPMFEEEGQIVYDAQLARGVRYDAGRRHSPRRYMRLARQFFLPLLVSALGKADALAVSMEGRCFGRYPTRTFLRQVHWHWRDGVALAGLVVVLGLAGAATYVLA
jgi:energy-coupling factor transport system permease protein